MAKNTQPVLKRARTLGVEPGFMGIDKQSRRNPNQSRRKKSDYAIQLNEKQKVKFVYGLLEKQFRNTFEKAAKRPGSTGVNLLLMLERRFDNVVYRMGFAATRREARQLVSHGHFMSTAKGNILPMELREGDVITVKTRARISPKFKQLRDMVITTPKWVTIDTDKLEGKIVALPSREDIDVPIAEHLIVELYSK